MGAPKKTDEYKKNYIKENAEIYVSRNKKNAETLKGYEEKSGDELHKVYFSVQTSVRNYNKKVEANTAETINLEIVNDSVPLTPKETIQKILNGYLTNGDIAYVEWKEIKVLLTDFMLSIDGKMKELAKEELDRAIEEREELNMGSSFSAVSRLSLAMIMDRNTQS